jgi:tetratricopeptide (TPR) repeat protein
MSENDRFTTEASPAFTLFWRRLPSFFLFPMKLDSILRIAGYSIISGVSLIMPQTLGGLLQLILWIVFLKYAFIILERTAVGQFDEPNGMNGDEGDIWQVVRQFGVIVMMGLLSFLLVYLFGMVGKNIALVLVNLLFPASIMIIAVTRSMGEALNPSRILFFIKTIGSPYFALSFVLYSVLSSGAWLQGFFNAFMDSWLSLPLLSFIEFYFVLITYHMMGYVIYQYHEGLGVETKVSFEQAEAKLSPGKATDPFLAKLRVLISNGQQEEAIDLLREELRLRWENNDLHERYQKLLMAAGKQIPALHHGREFIYKLVTEKRFFQALDLCEQCLKMDPEFQLQDSTQVLELASAARIGRRQQLALNLMRRFDRRYPEHPHIPAIYLLTARILGEDLNRYQEALQILHAIPAKFPDHALVSEARQHQEVITKLAAIT